MRLTPLQWVICAVASIEQGEQRLFDEIRYFFYLTNDAETPATDIVFLANDRCNQENLIDQLKHGVGATRMPVDTLLSNRAYMVMAALAWTLKAWFALLLPDPGSRPRRAPDGKTHRRRRSPRGVTKCPRMPPTRRRRCVFPARRPGCAARLSCVDGLGRRWRSGVTFVP